ncbi:SDR family oxidoreductase [Brevibacterium sp. SMBL_HHYL_HB1]|uniref:SDR family oxidoreductase n=1 Tax=Brevibacterium sp. SMBL_HHYL_HB1 TaxID=2777556 RepID=UPI001BA93ABA|nr:SDR family oxidoreductase [Brevibacterium sp. SMBL_HHYL_HB1]
MSDTAETPEVLIIGATGTIGRHCVTAAGDAGLRPRALVRNVAKAEELFPGVDLVQADLEDPKSLKTALEGASLIVMTHGAPGEADAGERIDYGGMRNVLQALGTARPRVALMSSVYATRTDVPGANPWKRRAERLLRASGLDHTIVRPGWFDRAAPNERRLVLEQGGTLDGPIARSQIAEVLIRSLITDSARGKTFELIAREGEQQTDWDTLFSPLSSDRPGDLDGALDPQNLPEKDEPQAIRDDLAAVRRAGN